MDRSKNETIRYMAPVLVGAIFLIILLIIPTGFEDAVIYKETDRCSAKVIEVNNDNIIDTGLVRSGEQDCKVELLGGKFKGDVVDAYNALNGSLETDKIFMKGDKAMVLVSYKENQVLSVNMVDHYRINYEIVLVAVFIVFLIVIAGRTGVRAIISFFVTILMIWKVLVPLLLKGYNPVWIGLCITALLTFIIISLVFGYDFYRSIQNTWCYYAEFRESAV